MHGYTFELNIQYTNVNSSNKQYVKQQLFC